MRLKQLEIKGFKSFADKTVINFDEGITGIIGPNGCGKSNIIDSIRWVIGEQKISALRSENLEALVFNGSKTRGASGLAEVSLTFENTKNLLPVEFSTVTVTRRFFKNGESEYRLNDVVCRLKDIHNLFLDTGVSNDSYAIIELGMVDDIIKDKDNSRRRMLEQAAGITIYKTRKKEAKAKLDATEGDLSRIEDLLFEINNQLKSLESQARKAEKYHELKKEYREIYIELAKVSLEGFNLTYKSLSEQQQTETDRKHQLEANIATTEASLETEKLDFIEKEKTLQTQQAAFNDMLQVLRTKENDKNLTKQKLHYLKEKETGLIEFLAKASGQQKSLEDSIAYTLEQVLKAEKSVNEASQKTNLCRQDLDKHRQTLDDARRATDTARLSYQQVQRNQFDTEKKVAVAETNLVNLQRSIFQQTQEQQQRLEQQRIIDIELSEKQSELDELTETISELRLQHERTKNQILDTQSELEKLRQDLAEENRKADALKNEHSLLKSMIDSMDGYPESIRFLKNNPAWPTGAPILSDIIYVEESYRAAVENVLAPYLNYYVVNNLQEGMDAIRLLDKEQKGKANFLLLDTIQASQESTKQPDNTKRALEVIEVDDKYKKLAEYLLGNVFIAENEDALQNTNCNVVIEKSGKFVKGTYTVAGGSVGIFEGKRIGRLKNLEKLLDEILIQDAVVQALKAEIKLKHDKVLHYNEQLKEREIRETEALINQLTSQVFALKNKLENIVYMFESAQKKISESEERLQLEIDNNTDTRDALADLNMRLTSASQNLQQAEENYKKTDFLYSEASNKYNEANLSYTKLQSQLSTLKQESLFKQNQLKDLHQQVADNQTHQQTIQQEIVQSTELLQKSDRDLEGLFRTKEESELHLNKADQDYYNLRNQLQEKESELRLLHKTKEQAEHLLSEIKDSLSELKLKLAGMKERLHVEFRIQLEDVLDEPRKTESSQEELQASSERIRKRIDNIGEVNPMAIEAFEEMKKRYEFIVEQKNDLVSAKESLLQTIQEVEATANQQFLDTFNKVRDNFQQVFKALFTDEDTADMVMENPENLAETGIDIIAKPKGKRPSSITQLSGGEKTLTATALLFAIYLIKPAPFCILDEVDAPLDDANVGKFTQMIQKFSDNSQFIIVTHNKMTMGSVDVIYGVTMQEPGVSKLVPVDFRNLN